MAISINPGYRAAAIGVASAALLVGAFSIGTSRSSGLARRAGRDADRRASPARLASPSPASAP